MVTAVGAADNICRLNSRGDLNILSEAGIHVPQLISYQLRLKVEMTDGAPPPACDEWSFSGFADWTCDIGEDRQTCSNAPWSPQNFPSFADMGLRYRFGFSVSAAGGRHSANGLSWPR